MPKCQMRFIAIIVCEHICQLTLSKDINFILFTLILSIQIVHNIINRQRYSISPFFLGVYASNIILNLYMLGFPSNSRMKAVNYSLCEAIIILAALQIIILVLQQIIGPYLGFEKLMVHLNISGAKELCD